MRSYEVKLRMEVEARSVDPVERRLGRLRKVAEGQGFHVSELHVRGLEDGEHRDLAGKAGAGV